MGEQVSKQEAQRMREWRSRDIQMRQFTKVDDAIWQFSKFIAMKLSREKHYGSVGSSPLGPTSNSALTSSTLSPANVRISGSMNMISFPLARK